jgi:hypothetical protein
MSEINVEIKQHVISVTMSTGATWDGISGRPTATEESSFIVSGASPFAWLVKTLAQVKTILGMGSIAAYNIWVGTEAEYAALGAWDNNTLYFTTA